MSLEFLVNSRRPRTNWIVLIVAVVYTQNETTSVFMSTFLDKSPAMLPARRNTWQHLDSVVSSRGKVQDERLAGLERRATVADQTGVEIVDRLRTLESTAETGLEAVRVRLVEDST